MTLQNNQYSDDSAETSQISDLFQRRHHCIGSRGESHSLGDPHYHTVSGCVFVIPTDLCVIPYSIFMPLEYIMYIILKLCRVEYG